MLIHRDDKRVFFVKIFNAMKGYISSGLILQAVFILTCFGDVRAEPIASGFVGAVGTETNLIEQKSASESNGSESKATVVVPPDIQGKYPDFIRMITHSDLMDNDEKQYWVDILPEMTTEQLEKLKVLLGSGNDKMDALDEKYRNELSELNKQAL